MRVRGSALALVGVAALAVAGCKTDLSVERVNDDQYVVTDEGGGVNPEKGINRTCPRRYIAGYRWIDTGRDKSIIVDCGPAR